MGRAFWQQGEGFVVSSGYKEQKNSQVREGGNGQHICGEKLLAISLRLVELELLLKYNSNCSHASAATQGPTAPHLAPSHSSMMLPLSLV